MTIEELMQTLEEHDKWIKENGFYKYTCTWPDCKREYYSLYLEAYRVCPDCKKGNR